MHEIEVAEFSLQTRVFSEYSMLPSSNTFMHQYS